MIFFVIYFFNLRMSPLHFQTEWVLFDRVRHDTFPCFYSSPEQTNQTLVVEMAFHTCVYNRTVEPICLEWRLS